MAINFILRQYEKDCTPKNTSLSLSTDSTELAYAIYDDGKVQLLHGKHAFGYSAVLRV